MAAIETEQVVPAGTWNADTVHSSVSFEVPYTVSTFSGEVPDFEAKLEDGRLKGVARVTSLQLKDENLNTHLQSPEFFDAERHPELRFESRSIDRQGDRVEIDGEITLKGTITGPSDDAFGNKRVGFNIETTVDRTDFDMNWNMPLPNGEPALSNDVVLRAELSLVGA